MYNPINFCIDFDVCGIINITSSVYIFKSSKLHFRTSISTNKYHLPSSLFSLYSVSIFDCCIRITEDTENKVGTHNRSGTMARDSVGKGNSDQGTWQMTIDKPGEEGFLEVLKIISQIVKINKEKPIKDQVKIKQVKFPKKDG